MITLIFLALVFGAILIIKTVLVIACPILVIIITLLLLDIAFFNMIKIIFKKRK